jgi:hypothetical protein
LKGEDHGRGARGRALLGCFLILGFAAPLALAQTPPIPEPDPAPAPNPSPPSSLAPAPVVSVQTPASPDVRETPRKRKRTKKPAPEPTFLAPIHAPDPGPALVVAAAVSAIPTSSSDDSLPVLPVLGVLAALGLLLVSLAAVPGWALARISGSLARSRTDIAFAGFVLLAGLLAALIVAQP